MRIILSALAGLIASFSVALGQAAQPVIPIVNGDIVSSSNPFPITLGGSTNDFVQTGEPVIIIVNGAPVSSGNPLPVSGVTAGCAPSGVSQGYLFNNGSNGCSTSTTLTTSGGVDTESGTLSISGLLSATTGIVVSGTNSATLSNNFVIEYLNPNARISLPSSESFYVYNQGRGTNLLMELNGSTSTLQTPAVLVGSATGGSEGAGTVNATAYYINGTSIASTFAPLASPTFTGTVTFPGAGTATTSGFGSLVALGVNQAAPSTYLFGVTGTTQTSSSANGIASLIQTWNTSGTPTAFTVAVTNTASNAASLLMNLLAGTGGATSEFSVSAAGAVVAAGNLTILGTITASSSNAATLQSSSQSGATTAGNANLVAGSNSQASGSNSGGSVNITAGNASGTGSTGNGGNVVITAGTTIGGTAGRIQLVNIISDAALTDSTLCYNTTSHNVYYGSGTLGICLGTSSSIRFKPDFALIADGLDVIRALDPGLYHYAPGIEDGGKKLQVGFTAERYAQVMPQFTRYDSEGRPNGLDMLAAFPYAVRAIQQVDDKVIAIVDSCREAANDNFCAQLLKRVGER